MKILESGNFVWNDAHHHRAAATLLENIYAKARHTRDAIREIRRSVFFEHSNGRLVLAHDVVGDVGGVLRGEALQPLVLQLDELAVYFDLRCAAGRKNQVTYLGVGLQHRGDKLCRVNGSLYGGWR
jgi:hypothetical protein